MLIVDFVDQSTTGVRAQIRLLRGNDSTLQQAHNDVVYGVLRILSTARQSHSQTLQARDFCKQSTVSAREVKCVRLDSLDHAVRVASRIVCSHHACITLGAASASQLRPANVADRTVQHTDLALLPRPLHQAPLHRAPG